MTTFRFPIAILSFNRPQILEAFLKTLRSQTREIDDRNVYLFQDGTKSRVKDAPYDATAQLKCVEVFNKIFPQGRVYYSVENLGIALNFDRAERFVFEELGAECSTFFEDDMLLSPYYLEAMDQLLDFALAEPKVAYVAAYGDHRATLDQQRKNASKIITMHHKWGFGLTRRQWIAQKPIIDGYLDIVRQAEYKDRDADRIKRYFQGFGYAGAPTSQDYAKDIASLSLGTTKLMCSPCYGKYIGEEGAHFNRQLFEKMGFGQTVLWTEKPEKFIMPSSSELDIWIANERKNAKAHAVAQSAPQSSAQAATPAAGPASGPIASLAPNPVTTADWELRMSGPEIELLRSYLVKASNYLEFGAGGSTRMAIDLVKGPLFSVESDAAWVAKLSAEEKVKAARASGRLTIVHSDIGPVGDWGVPKDETKLKNWKSYYTRPWVSTDKPFDFVLIDGRFRVMCALMAAVYAPDHAFIAIHDYTVRKHYFVVEKYFDTVDGADTLVIMKKRRSINFAAWVTDMLTHLYDVN